MFKKNSKPNSILSGICASVASQTAIWPSEVLKMNLQKYPHNSHIAIIKDILKRDGIMGFSRGFAAAACSNVPQACVRFTIYKELEAKGYGYLECTVPTIAINTFLCTPFVNMAMSRMIQGGTKINTLQGAYRGWRTLLLKNSIKTGTQFNVYRWLREQTYEYLQDSYIIRGGIATSASSLINNPVDVVLTHIQTDYKNKYKGSIKSATADLYSKHGIGCFLKGAGIRTARAFPGGAVFFYIFETVSSALDAAWK